MKELFLLTSLFFTIHTNAADFELGALKGTGSFTYDVTRPSNNNLHLSGSCTQLAMNIADSSDSFNFDFAAYNCGTFLYLSEGLPSFLKHGDQLLGGINNDVYKSEGLVRDDTYTITVTMTPREETYGVTVPNPYNCSRLHGSTLVNRVIKVTKKFTFVFTKNTDGSWDFTRDAAYSLPSMYRKQLSPTCFYTDYEQADGQTHIQGTVK